MKKIQLLTILTAIVAFHIAGSSSQASSQAVVSQLTSLQAPPAAGQLVLKNDGYNEQSGQGSLQMGFIAGEKAGIWVKVPASIKLFKVEAFRVLLLEGQRVVPGMQQIYFEMGVSASTSPAILREIDNAAQVTPGPYWNDIPAQGSGSGSLRCAKGGEYVGAAIEFSHSGLPSIMSDTDGLSSVQGNTLMAIPDGWNYSVAYGLKGDWVLRIVGHEATESECH